MDPARDPGAGRGPDPGRPAEVADVHALATAMPHVTCVQGPSGNPVYQVGGKSFVFFRNPRPDAVDPVTGERYDDVIVFWVADEADKRSLVEDPDSPFFTTPHFNGHLSVLLRGKHVPELSYAELAEVVQDAWLSRASPRRAAQWLEARGLETRSHATVREDTGVDLKILTVE
ncbi:MAG: MmcQ/YjbR family DNA-binding protein [Trebonia sp.]